MSLALLSTKLFIPPLRLQFLSRQRLSRKLIEELSIHHLILVSAPAGFGKTSLVSEWIQKSGLKAAWVSLDDGDNDPVSFWSYVTAAFQTINPQVGQNLASALSAPTPPPITALLSGFINDLTALNQKIIFVLDDYHLIQNEKVHESLNYFIDHLSPDIHVLLCTRSDPPLQLSLRRGRGELGEIRAADLRFNGDESSLLFNGLMQLDLEPGDIRVLEQRTEGWIAGLQMAGLSMDGLPDKHGFVCAFNSDDRYIADYLIEEVLHRQPPAIQEFLLITSILDRFCASLCNALTGLGSAESILIDLDRSNLFIFPLDNRRSWYRYHHLFASLLRQRLLQKEKQEKVQDLYLKAATWFEQNRLWIDAVQIACSAPDLNLALDLLDKHIYDLFVQGELVKLNRLGSLFSNAMLKTHPHVLMGLAWAANATGSSEKLAEYIKLLEAFAGMDLPSFLAIEDISLMDPSQRMHMVEIAVLSSRMALDHFDIPMIEKIAQKALPYLAPEHDRDPFLFNNPSSLRPPLVYMLGFYHQMVGNVKESSRLLLDAAESGSLNQNIHIVALSYGLLGQVQMAMGSLYQAEKTFNLSIAAVTAFTLMKTPYISYAWLGLASIAYERNDFSGFEKYIHNAIDSAQVWQSSELLFPAYLLLAKYQALAGLWEDVGRSINKMDQLPEEFLRDNGAPLLRFKVWVRYQKGQQSALTQWADSFSPISQSPIPFIRETEAAVDARLLLLTGRVEMAKQLIESFLAVLEASLRRGRFLEFLMLHALSLAASGQMEPAKASLYKALQLAQPENYRRLFLDEGEAMQHLLEKLLPDLTGPVASYTQQLIDWFGKPTGEKNQGIIPSELIEPLSPREIEVLQLITGGISNAEIGSQLFVSVNTVKKHLTNIFNKLGVENRLQAIEKARRLGIL